MLKQQCLNKILVVKYTLNKIADYSNDEKQKAVNLVKAQWGEDNTVSFQCDHVTSDGEYVVAVSSLSSAKVLNYFRVNVEDGIVEVEY